MPDLCCYFYWQDVGLWLEEINLGGYRQIFKENGVNGEYLEGMSMFTTEQILRFIRRCHMKWGDFITLCKELRRIKVACLKGEQRVRRPWWAPSCLSIVFTKVAKRNRQSRVVSLKLEPWYTDMYLCMYNFKWTGGRKTTCLRIFPTLSFRLFFLLVLLWRTSSSVQAFYYT